jgi:hypothetical protein
MSIEAMKLALEALENSIDDVRDCLNQNLPLAGYARYDQRIEWYREQIAKHEDAITSLRQVIEQAEKQEPVAWCVLEPWLSGKFEAQDCFSDVALDANVGWVPLYTTPQPQREWVGLTDEEISQLWLGTSPYFNEEDFARAIEAKLKEKNT